MLVRMDHPLPPAARGPAYRERLWPGPVGWLVLLGVVVTVAIAVLPLGAELSLGVGLVIGLALVVTAVRTSPRVEVGGGHLLAGPARIPVTLLGEPEVLDAEGRRAALGPELDARAYVVLRGWIPGAVRVRVEDEADPTPYWVVSTRDPEGLARAIRTAQQRAAR